VSIIKEKCKFDGEKKYRYIIRSNTYAHTFEYFNNLVSEAKKDFPGLKDLDIDIIHYGGIRYKYTFGIEFNRKECNNLYYEISQIETKL
jgi:hypothetical protein